MGGMRALGADPQAWLSAELGHMRWAWGPTQSIGCGQVTAYYFRSIHDAQRFIAAFPQLEIADGVASPVYSSPTNSAGPTPVDPRPHVI